MVEESKVFVVKWTIENFLFCTQRNKEYLTSPGFVVDGIERSKWELRLYPRGSSNLIEEIELLLFKTHNLRTSVVYELSFLDEDGRVDIISERREEYFHRELPEVGRKNFINRSEVLSKLGNYPSKSSLVIRCCFWISDGAPSGQCFLRTHIGMQRSACNWILNEFKNMKSGEEKFRAIPFATSKAPALNSLRLLFYITHGPRCDENLNVEIELPSTIPHRFAWCRLSILDQAEKFEQCDEEEFWLKTPPDGTVWKFRPFLTPGKQQNRYFSRRNIRLLCDLVLSEGVVHECVEETLRYPDRLEKWFPPFQPVSKMKIQTLDQSDTTVHHGTLESDLRFLQTENIMCDMKLRTHTCIFLTQSVILSARSPVFRAMFNADMKEKCTESVDIVDLEDDTVRRLLKFMYTDTVEELRMDTAKKLYFAADKYQVSHLKKKCADFFVGNLTADNVCEVLTFADMHNDDKLKKYATDFVLCSRKTVFESQQWKTLMKENGCLAAQVMYIIWSKELDSKSIR